MRRGKKKEQNGDEGRERGRGEEEKLSSGGAPGMEATPSTTETDDEPRILKLVALGQNEAELSSYSGEWAAPLY